MKTDVFVRSLQLEQDPGPVLKALLAKTDGLKNLEPGSLVLLKPNFVAPFQKATTDLAFLEVIIEAVRQARAVPVVGESSGFEFDTEATLSILGVRKFLDLLDVEFINFEDGQYITLEMEHGLPPLEVAEVAVKADLIINLPVLKGHTITKMTGATKNFFGLLSRPARRRLHCKGLDKGIALLARSFPQSVHIMDARRRMVRAVFSDPKPLNYCLAGSDPFTLDHFGCLLLGINPLSVWHLDRIPHYTLDGPPYVHSEMNEKASTKERLHRALYAGFYYFDELKSKTIGGQSIIPHLHWTLGIHPDLSQVPADRLPELAQICPVKAIDPTNGRLKKELCIHVRCLRCYFEDPTGSVKLKGLNHKNSV